MMRFLFERRPTPGLPGERVTRIRRPSLPALVACLALAAGCGSEGGPAGDAAKPAAQAKQAAKVDIAKFEFAPKTVRVKAGGSVTWLNEDAAKHNAESEPSAPGKFDTDTLKKNGQKEIRLDEPGRYSYFCGFHRFMEGTVEVVQ